MKKITFDEKGTPHIKIDDAVTEAFSTDKAMKNTMKDRVNVREYSPYIELATADGDNTTPMKDASQDDLLGEISARMKDKDETIAFLKRRVNEFVKSNARLTEEKQRLTAADTERKRLRVSEAMLKEEVSRLRGQLSQETKKRKEAEEAARNATERYKQCLEKIDDLRREACLLYGQMWDMAEAEQASTELDKDEISREAVDRMIDWAEELGRPKERRAIKRMLYDKFSDIMTDGQRKRLADLDRRDTGRQAPRQVNVSNGSTYIENVERQDVSPDRSPQPAAKQPGRQEPTEVGCTRKPATRVGVIGKIGLDELINQAKPQRARK